MLPGLASFQGLSNVPCVGPCCPLFSHSAFNGRVIASAFGSCEQCCSKCGVHVSVFVPALNPLTLLRIAGSYADPVFNCSEELQAVLSFHILNIDAKALSPLPSHQSLSMAF